MSYEVTVNLTPRQIDALLDVAINKANAMVTTDVGDQREHYALVGAMQRLQQAKATLAREAVRA